MFRVAVFPLRKTQWGIILSCNCRSSAKQWSLSLFFLFFCFPPSQGQIFHCWRSAMKLREVWSLIPAEDPTQSFFVWPPCHTLIWLRVLLGTTGSFFFYPCAVISVRCLTLTENHFYTERVHPCFINISNNNANHSELVKKTYNFHGTAEFDVEGE